MAKKLRLSPEEKQMLSDCCKTLPKVPIMDKLGDPITAKRRVLAATLIQNYEQFIAEGYNIPKISILSKDKNAYWDVAILSYIDTEKRMKKALLEGRLPQEVENHRAQHALFIQRQIDLKTPKEKPKDGDIEKMKQAECERYYRQEKAKENKRLGHTRKRYHK